MAHEIELKLALPKSAHAAFGRQPLLRNAADRQSVKLFNIYYDTPDLALRERGIALRLRREGERWLQTVKCASETRAGLSFRPEWETPYHGHFDFSPIDDAAVADWLGKKRIRERLLPVFETNFQRTLWRVETTNARLAVMLDKGWIVAAGRRESISEVEIELIEGNIDELFSLARTLAMHQPLVPVRQSKAERGYSLYKSVLPAPARARQVELDATVGPLKALQRIALSCLEHLQDNRIGAMVSDDPEYIHQMRVAARRLRAALRLFQPVLPAGFTDEILPALRAHMAVLGQARDLDVLLVEIAEPVLAAHPDDPQLAELIGVLTERRHEARQRVAELLGSPAFGRDQLLFLGRFHLLFSTSPEPSSGLPTLRSFAHERLQRLRRKVLKLAQRARSDDPVSLHTLRIAIKRLRYALEFFAPLAARKSVERTVAALAGLQDVFGQINDLVNANRLLSECAGSDERLSAAAQAIIANHEAREQELLARVPEALASLRELPLPRLRATHQP